MFSWYDWVDRDIMIFGTRGVIIRVILETRRWMDHRGIHIDYRVAAVDRHQVHLRREVQLHLLRIVAVDVPYTFRTMDVLAVDTFPGVFDDDVHYCVVVEYYYHY